MPSDSTTEPPIRGQPDAQGGAGDPWRLTADGLDPIAESLERFSNTVPLDLAERLRTTARRPSNEMAGEWLAFGTGLGRRDASAGKLEMVVDCLRFHGHPEDARRVDKRVRSFLDQVRQWEDDAYRAMYSTQRMGHCERLEEAGRRVELADRFGEGIREAHYELMDRAHSVADYLRRLAAMVRGAATPAADAVKQLAQAKPADAPETMALTPNEQAFLEALTDEPRTGPDLVVSLARQGYRNFDESTISRMWRRPPLKARGVRHRKGAGYYLCKTTTR